MHANLHDLIAGIPITPEDVEANRRRRELNAVVHKLLTVGLAISTAVMMVGLVLDIVSVGEISGSALPFAQSIRVALSLHGSGFLALGLLVLIATPILRVVGAFVAFLHERDWRYAELTLAVLVILCISVVFGGR